MTSTESRGSRSYPRRGLRWGVVTGSVLLVGITLVVLFMGMRHGFSGEAFVLWGYFAFVLSLPITAWVIWLSV